MIDLHAGEDAARDEVVELTKVVHRYLPDSGLSVRQRVDVHRDLTFLLLESHRHRFRPRVAVEVCASLLVEVSHALPETLRATMLRSCADHLGWVDAADTGSLGEVIVALKIAPH